MASPADSPDLREFLDTNGIGGYVSATLCGMNTRRYHGLLVAATDPPAGRSVLLSKIEETLVLGADRFELSCNQYPGVVHPAGHRFLTGVTREPFVTFSYEAGGARVEKTILTVDGENTTIIEYRVTGRAAELELRPLLAYRDYHALTHENAAIDHKLVKEPGYVAITPYSGMPTLFVAHAAEVTETGEWYRNFTYDRERERGLDFQEDLFQPYVLRAELSDGGRMVLIASTSRRKIEDADGLRASELSRRTALGPPTSLARAADQFVVRRGSGHSILAGYHWFADWTRDAMIALPGLTLATGRFDVAREILDTFAGAASEGMLPNRFSDAGGAPEYNNVDGTLWFFEAARAYAAATGDFEFLHARLYSALAEIVEWHVRGTRYGIRVDDDGLLHVGAAGVALTWMDAIIGGQPVTPRSGKPVEVQALWYNALRVMEDFAQRFGDRAAARYRQMADRAAAAFNWEFWNSEADCLYDVVTANGPDPSFRPNQIFAVSLPHSMLPAHRAAQVVKAVREKLLTPFGLRTLATDDPSYHGRFDGSPAARDGAYHQGTVWPWLLGPFVHAYLRVDGYSEEALEHVRGWMEPLARYLDGDGAGQLPEVFDGDPPQRAGGCIAQAWSVAEFQRVQHTLAERARTSLHTSVTGSSVS